MSKREPTHVVALFVSTFFLLSTGCKGEEERGDGEDAGTDAPMGSLLLPVTEDCDGLSIAEDHAPPFALVGVALPDGVDRPWLHVVPENRATAIYAPLYEANEGDGWFFATPPYPSLQGGPVQVQVTNGVVTCPAIEFHIDSIPSAPGTTREVLTRLRASAYGGLEKHGLTQEAIAASVLRTGEAIEVRVADPELAPLLVIAFLLDHPANEYSAAKMLDSSSAEDLEFADALLAHYLATDSAGVENPSALGDWRVAAALPLFDSCFEEVVDEESLSIVMNECGHPRCNQVGSKLGAVANHLSVLSTAGSPDLAAAAVTGFTATTTALLLYSAYMCATRPDHVEKVEVVPDPLQIEEDYDGPKSMEVKVLAKGGAPFVITESIAQAALTLVAIFVKPPENPKFEEYAEGIAYEFLSAVMVPTLKFIGLGVGSTIGPEEFSVRFDELEYLEVIPRFNHVIARQMPDAVGIEALKVEYDACVVAPVPEKFASNLKSYVVETPVKPITPDLGPVLQSVSPGTVHTIEYEVEHAVDPSLQWEAPFPLSETSTDAASGTVEIQLPADESVYPIRVYAKSTSTTGLRALPNRPERFDYALLVIGDLEAGPDGRCVEPGEELPLWADAREIPNETYEIVWQSPYVDEEGVFTAPTAEATHLVDVLVRYSNGSEFTDQVAIRVGDCRCWYEVDVRGADSFYRSGTFGVTVRTSYLNPEMTEVLKTIDIDFPDGDSADAAIVYERAAGATADDGYFPGGAYVLLADSDLTGGSDTPVHIWKTPSGHYMAEWIGVVTNSLTALPSVARVTIHGVGEDEDAGIKCLEEDFYMPPASDL